MTQFHLTIIHKLEWIRRDCMNAHEYEAAHSLDNIIELLRKQYELELVEWENRYNK